MKKKQNLICLASGILMKKLILGVYTWGRGTLMTFNTRNQGTIGSAGDPDYLMFEWRWIDGGYNSMELYFYGDGTYAYIWGAEATGRDI